MLFSPSPFVLNLRFLAGQTKTFLILFNTIPPCPSQTGEGDTRERREVEEKYMKDARGNMKRTSFIHFSFGECYSRGKLKPVDHIITSFM